MIARPFVASLGAIVLLLASFQDSARADGIFVWKNEDVDIREPEQKALLRFDDGVEDLVLSVRFEGAPEEFGWIVPTPAVPELREVDALLFEQLSRMTQHRQIRRSRRGAALHQTMGMDRVQILKTESVGIYDATVLRADDGSSLRRWLRDNGFRMPRRGSRVLDRYAREGWTFTALRIRPAEQDAATGDALASGEIQPIRLTFACEEPVFPLEISSLAGGDAVVLLYVLARTPLVPAGLRADWDTRVWSGTEQAWIDRYRALTGDEQFASFASVPSFLTKHRARIEARRMEDVTFQPYRPAEVLQGRDSDDRTDAIVHLGTTKPRGAEQQLVAAARRKPVDADERVSLLWALGQVGGDEATDVLIEFAGSDDLEIRVEAMEALSEIGSSRGLFRAIEGLTPREGGGDPQAGWRKVAAQEASLDYLLQHGNETCLDPLRRIADRRDGENDWRRPSALAEQGEAWDPGLLAVAALSACGDEEALRAIVDAVVAGGEVTTPAGLAETADLRVVDGGFPGGFWTGLSAQRPHSWPVRWEAFQILSRLLGSVPDHRDRVLRLAAGDPRLPDAGSVMLTANLELLTEEDLADLRSRWRRALREPVMLDVSHWGQGSPPATVVRFNVVACEVAYALGRHAQAEELRALAAEVPEGDEMLRGEVLFAMAKTRGAHFDDEIVAHLRAVWDPAFRDSSFEERVRGELDGRAVGPLFGFLHRHPPELPWRAQAVQRYLGTLDAPTVQSLIGDEALAPYLRLLVIEETNLFRSGYAGILPVARAALDEMVGESASPTLSVCVSEIRARLDRVEAALAVPEHERLRRALR